MLNNSRKLGSKHYSLNQDYRVSPKTMVDVCHMSRTIAYHLLKDGEASYPIAKLLDLHCRGRILPEEWNHTFFNKNDDLEINGVEALKEGQVSNLHWLLNMKEGQVERLEQEKAACRGIYYGNRKV
jgi:hypothetical protein